MLTRLDGIAFAVPFFLVFAGTGADAATIRVPADQPTIQAGIDAATAPGDVVLVAPGMYTGPGNRDIELRGRDIVVRSESGAAATIIGCEDLGRGFHVHQGETAAAVIEGFTIRRGLADGGGGMRIAGASPTVMACVITDCESYHVGGGVEVQSSSSLFTDCEFTANQGFNFGGGLFFRQSSPTLRGCEIRSNQLATGAGGGVYGEDCPLLIIEDCLFSDNHAGSQGSNGGGISAGTVRLLRCVFDGNSANHGGGLSAGPGTSLEECVFLDNTGFSELIITGSGGAISGWGPLSLDHCTLARNVAEIGSGIDYGGGSTTLTIDNTIVAFNAGGSGIACGTASALLTCTDVHGNAGGDWVGCIAGQAGLNGNLAADPLFCGLAAGDLTINEASPCAPAQSGTCGLIGALPVGCGATAVEAATWGGIKSRMRAK